VELLLYSLLMETVPFGELREEDSNRLSNFLVN
jgi:hypothetical protein